MSGERPTEPKSSGGRPTERKARPELERLRDWYLSALRDARFDSPNHFMTKQAARLKAAGLTKHIAYDLFSGRRLGSLDEARMLASCLGRDPSSVDAEWKRANRAAVQITMAQRSAGEVPARQTGWAELPIPECWLEELLRSQASAAEVFPYELLGVRKPPLSDVFVEPDIQPLADGSGHPARSKEVVSTLAEALANHEHLFITGIPGAGKTTIANHLVNQLSKAWLREGDIERPWCGEVVVPIRVAAADLSASRPWSQQLSDAAVRAGGLISPIEQDNFMRRPHGFRWLVNVDGLDEISSRHDRDRILRTLAEVAKRHRTFRLLITSRPLSQEELEPFAKVESMGFYRLAGFEPAQQRNFVERWFVAQGRSDAGAIADRMSEEVEAAGLAEVLQTPLLTTICAIIFGRNPNTPLPRGRISLYESFLRELGSAHHRSSRDEIPAERSSPSTRFGLSFEWMLRHRDALVADLAWKSLGADPDRLLDRAQEWIRNRLPFDGDWPSDFKAELGHFLSSTGVLSYDGHEVHFLHRSFAEYIAARDDAGKISSGFPDLKDRLESIGNAAARTRILFTLAIWAQRPENNVSMVVRHLLGGSIEHRIMALRLVTSGVPLGETFENSVIDRLLDFGDKSGSGRFTSSASAILRELSILKGNRRLMERLRLIAGNVRLESALRIEAAIALAHVSNLNDGVEVITEIAESAGPKTLLSCYAAFSSLVPRDTATLIYILERVIDDQRSGSSEKLRAAELMSDLGIEDRPVAVARSILTSPERSGNIVQRAGELWLDAEGADAIDAVTEIVLAKPVLDSWMAEAIAAILIRCNRYEEALPYVRILMDDPADSDGLGDLIQYWLYYGGVQAANWIVDAHRDQIMRDMYRLTNVAQLVLDSGFISQAVELVRLAIDDHESDRFYMSRYGMSLLVEAMGVDATDEVIDYLGSAPISPDDRIAVVRELIEAGTSVEVVAPVARGVLNHPGCSSDSFSHAADLLFTVGDDDVAQEVLDAMRNRPYDTASVRTAALPVLASHGAVAAVTELVREAIAYDVGTTVAELRVVLDATRVTQGRGAVAQISTDLGRSLTFGAIQLNELAEYLAESGDTPSAISLWCRALELPGGSVDMRWRILQKLIQSGAAQDAQRSLEAAHLNATTPEERDGLQRLIAWAAEPSPVG